MKRHPLVGHQLIALGFFLLAAISTLAAALNIVDCDKGNSEQRALNAIVQPLRDGIISTGNFEAGMFTVEGGAKLEEAAMIAAAEAYFRQNSKQLRQIVITAKDNVRTSIGRYGERDLDRINSAYAKAAAYSKAQREDKARFGAALARVKLDKEACWVVTTEATLRDPATESQKQSVQILVIDPRTLTGAAFYMFEGDM
jgi:hypothetical protein